MENVDVVQPEIIDVETVLRRPVSLIGFQTTAPLDALRTRSLAALRTMAVLLDRADVRPDGPATVVFRPNSRPDTFEVTAGYSLPAGEVLGFELVTDRLPGGPAMQAVHHGPWETLLGTYDQLGEWLAARQVHEVPLMWEEYLVGPETSGDVHDWRTRVVVPLPRSR